MSFAFFKCRNLKSDHPSGMDVKPPRSTNLSLSPRDKVCFQDEDADGAFRFLSVPCKLDHFCFPPRASGSLPASPPVPCPPTGTDSGGLLGLPPLQVVGPVGGSGSVHRLLTAGGDRAMATDQRMFSLLVEERRHCPAGSTGWTTCGSISLCRNWPSAQGRLGSQ